jgi:hypothetical protein
VKFRTLVYFKVDAELLQIRHHTLDVTESTDRIQTEINQLFGKPET